MPSSRIGNGDITSSTVCGAGAERERARGRAKRLEDVEKFVREHGPFVWYYSDLLERMVSVSQCRCGCNEDEPAVVARVSPVRQVRQDAPDPRLWTTSRKPV